jgi:hypothetical protein
MAEGQAPPGGREDAQKRFLRALDELAKSVRGNAEATELKAQHFEVLLAHIAHPEDGLIKAIDDNSAEFCALTQEIRGLRKDLRDAARAGGLRGVFDRLLGS